MASDSQHIYSSSKKYQTPRNTSRGNMQDVVGGDYKNLLKGIKEDINKWKIHSYTGNKIPRDMSVLYQDTLDSSKNKKPQKIVLFYYYYYYQTQHKFLTVLRGHFYFQLASDELNIRIHMRTKL